MNASFLPVTFLQLP